MLLSLGVGVALAGVVALGGVDNPTGDYEIFRMNPDGSGVKQLTTNTVLDFAPVLSPDKTKVAYQSYGKLTSNPEGDYEIYVMNALDGRGKKNLSNNGTGVDDSYPVFSSDGGKIAYTSYGIQDTNPQGDREIYRMSALDGTDQKNLTNNASGVYDGVFPD